MRIIITTLFICSSFIIFAQIDRDSTNITPTYENLNLLGEATYDHLFDFKGRRQIGTTVILGTEFFRTKKTSLSFRFGYRYANFFDDDQSEKTENYSGLVLGFEFNGGKTHQLQAALLFDIGGYRISTPSINNPTSSFSIFSGSVNPRIGYQYYSDKNFFVKAGAQAYLGRGGSQYLSIGYYVGVGGYLPELTIEPKIKPRINSKEKLGYFAISAGVGLGAHTGFKAMVNVQLDHFPYSTEAVDLGYSIGVNPSITSDYVSLRLAFTGLLGRGAAQFEYSAGINYDVRSEDPLYLFNFLHMGLGLRLSTHKIPFFFKIGTATTSWGYVGIGFKFGTKKNPNYQQKVPRLFQSIPGFPHVNPPSNPRKKTRM